MPFTFGDVYEGEVSQASCVLSRGDPPVRIEWFYNDRPINASEDISIIPTGTRGAVLLIQSLASHHMGNYTCVASNRVASSSYTAPLIINGSTEITDKNFKFFFIHLFFLVKFAFINHLLSPHLRQIHFKCHDIPPRYPPVQYLI